MIEIIIAAIVGVFVGGMIGTTIMALLSFHKLTEYEEEIKIAAQSRGIGGEGMREILFRGKRLDNGEWVYGDIIHRRYYKNTDVVVIRTEDSGFDNYSDYEVDPDTVGQYTGLTDKNGRKIFEGDCFKTYCAGLPVYKHIVGYYPEHFAFMARCIEMNTVHYLSDYRPYYYDVYASQDLYYCEKSLGDIIDELKT